MKKKTQQPKTEQQRPPKKMLATKLNQSEKECELATSPSKSQQQQQQCLGKDP